MRGDVGNADRGVEKARQKQSSISPTKSIPPVKRVVCSGAISPATNPRLKARAFTLFKPYCFCHLVMLLKRLVFVPILSDFSCHPERKSRDLSASVEMTKTCHSERSRGILKMRTECATTTLAKPKHHLCKAQTSLRKRASLAPCANFTQRQSRCCSTLHSSHSTLKAFTMYNICCTPA